MSTHLAFSLEGYRELIALLVRLGWRFTSYAEAGSSSKQTNSLLLRHDIDAELCLLEPFLEIEQLSGVMATYFVMLESPMYNVYSPEGRKAIERIIESGHSIGLHFFSEIHKTESESQLTSLVEEQCLRLAALVGREVNTFSLHQPTQTILNMNISPPGIINTYHPRIMNGFRYLSDTNMNWRSNDPLEILNRLDKCVQLLIHPIWWMIDGDTPVDRWHNLLRLLSKVNANHLLQRERTLADIPLARLLNDN